MSQSRERWIESPPLSNLRLSFPLLQLVYRKDREETMKHFTQVSDSVGTRQAQSQQMLASQVGYQTAPHE